MKGVTNAQTGVAVKTGVTVDMMMNIPDDVPWDLAFIGAEGGLTIMHGIGPATTTKKAIIGTRYYSGSGNGSTMLMLNNILVSDNIITVAYKRIANTTPGSGTFNMTDSELANAKLYLYGGGGL